MAENIIYIGSVDDPLFTFTGDNIISCVTNAAVSSIGEELSIDSFEAVVSYDGSEGSLRAVQYATNLYYYRGTERIAKFYFTQIKRTARTQYTIYGVSFVGLLDKQYFYGGMYHGAPFGSVLRQIICSRGVERYMQLSAFTVQATEASSTRRGVRIADSVYGNNDVTLQCRLHARLKVISSSLTSVFSGTYILGSGLPSDHWYGITAGKSNNNLRLSFRYGSTEIYIYRAASTHVKFGDTVEVDCDPANSRLTITVEKAEGGSYTRNPTITPIADTTPLPMYAWGGGVYNTAANLVTHNSDIEYEFYRIYDPNGNLLIDAKPLKGLYDNSVILKNEATGYTAPILCATGDAADIAFPDSDSNGTTIKADSLLQEIMEDIGVSAELEDIPVYGWIPITTKRVALYQLIFASCVNLVRDGSGYCSVSRLQNDSIISLADRRIYNSGEVDQREDVARIELTEHAYSAVAELKEVFNNSAADYPDDYYIVQLEGAPVSGDLEISGTGFQLLSYNCNAAYVYGKGAISGYPYEDARRVLQMVFSDEANGKAVSVSDATLVNFFNSENVMNRLVAYYSAIYKIRNEIAHLSSDADQGVERCGQRYSFLNAFGENELGFLSRLKLTASETLKASCDFDCGYVVPDVGTGFSHYVLLTGSGTWTLPSGVEKIKVVLIGGGQGGSSGYKGEDGDNVRDEWRTTVPAAGGMYGESGTPGKILETTINSPAASYAYSCGSGGAGGAQASSDGVSNPGSDGTATTFGSFSSANGASNDLGIYNYLSGTRYAYKPDIWSEVSGKGGTGGYVILNADGTITHVRGESVYDVLTGRTYPGSGPGADIIDLSGTVIAVGGSGAGGSIGATSVADGYAATYSNSVYEGGRAAHGASGQSYTLPVLAYGCGGIGGQGGGGGGSIGGVRTGYPAVYWASGYYELGGNGCKGGTGGAGCIIVYY